MERETADYDRDWHYGPANTVAGELQRGLGRGAHHVLRDGAADLVLGCLRRDYRWDWQVDDRCLYLARLVRDLGIPPPDGLPQDPQPRDRPSGPSDHGTTSL